MAGSRRKNLIGQRFGRFTVLDFSHVENSNAHWVAQCDCGNVEIVEACKLKSKSKKKACTACSTMLRFGDLTGQRFGKLTVLGLVGSNGNRYWDCLCDCGNKVHTTTAKLRAGKISCARCAHKMRADQQRGVPRVGPGEATKRTVWHYYRGNAKRKGLEFALTYDEFSTLTAGNCHYCGRPPMNRHMKSRLTASGPFIHNGIDRVDNSKGYVLGNVVSCCKTCNKAKNDMDYQEFVDWVRLVAKHLELC